MKITLLFSFVFIFHLQLIVSVAENSHEVLQHTFDSESLWEELFDGIDKAAVVFAGALKAIETSGEDVKMIPRSKFIKHESSKQPYYEYTKHEEATVPDHAPYPFPPNYPYYPPPPPHYPPPQYSPPQYPPPQHPPPQYPPPQYPPPQYPPPQYPPYPNPYYPPFPNPYYPQYYQFQYRSFNQLFDKLNNTLKGQSDVNIEIINRCINQNYEKDNIINKILEEHPEWNNFMHFSEEGFQCDEAFCKKFGDGNFGIGICTPLHCNCAFGTPEGKLCNKGKIYDIIGDTCDDPITMHVCGI